MRFRARHAKRVRILRLSLHERLRLRLEWKWEKLWLCKVRGLHVDKLDSHGKCYRCGKGMRD